MGKKKPGKKKPGKKPIIIKRPVKICNDCKNSTIDYYPINGRNNKRTSGVRCHDCNRKIIRTNGDAIPIDVTYSIQRKPMCKFLK